MNWFRRLPTNQKAIVIGLGVGLLYLGYRWYENKQSASSAASQTAQQTAADEGEAAEGSGYYGGWGDTGTGTTATGTTTTTTTTPATTAPPKEISGPVIKGKGPSIGNPAANIYGLNEQHFSQGNLAEIGFLNPGGLFNGRNVGGGAPVYFWDPATKKLTTGLSAAQVAALPQGTQVFTPVSDYADISSNIVHNQRINR